MYKNCDHYDTSTLIEYEGGEISLLHSRGLSRMDQSDQ